MTEAEVIESVALLGTGAVSVFTLFISVVFAYLTAAYFLGRQLKRVQVLVITGLFLVTSATLGATCIACVLAWETLVRLNPTVLTTIPYFATGIWHYCMAVIFSGGVLASLYFMYNVRSTPPVAAEKVRSDGAHIDTPLA